MNDSTKRRPPKLRLVAKEPPPSNAELEAFHVIQHAANVWRERAGSGDAVARAVSLVLGELAGVALIRDLDALEGKGGPVQWARSRQKTAAKKWAGERPIHPIHPTKADAARELVGYLTQAKAGPDPTPNRVASAAIRWCESRGVETGLLTTTIRDLRSAAAVGRRKQMRREVLALYEKRTVAPDAKACAVAALIGWGLTRSEARSVLQQKDT